MSNYFDSLTPEERDEIRSRKPKTFYEIVLDELDEIGLEHGLCSASKTFFKYFKNFDFREKIVGHAKVYHDQSEFKNDFRVNDVHNYDDEFLFIGRSNFKTTRIDFINFCVRSGLNIL